MTQISVRVSVGAGTISDMKVMASTKCWTIVAVSIYGVFSYLGVKHERFQAIFVFEGKNEAVS